MKNVIEVDETSIRGESKHVLRTVRAQCIVVDDLVSGFGKAKRYALDLAGFYTLGMHNVQQAVQSRMDEGAAGIQLKVNLHDLEAFAQAFEERRLMPFPSECLAQWVLALED